MAITRIKPIRDKSGKITLKYCCKCSLMKEPIEFFVARSQSTGLSSYCKLCYRKYNNSTTRKNAALKRKYSWTLGAFNEMAAQQDWKCVICLKEPDKRGLVVDHNHETGTIRGLLCSRCNLIIGQAQENPVYFDQVRNYILKHNLNLLPIQYLMRGASNGH